MHESACACEHAHSHVRKRRTVGLFGLAEQGMLRPAQSTLLSPQPPEKQRKIPAMPVDDGLQAQHELKKFQARLKTSETNLSKSQTNLKDAKARELLLEEQVAALRGRLSQENAKCNALERLISSLQTEVAALREQVSRSENERARAQRAALPMANLQKGRHNADQTALC